MNKYLRTMLNKVSVIDYVTSIRDILSNDKNGLELYIIEYAITLNGWHAIKESVIKWKAKSKKRNVIIFVGLDHAITEPSALKEMMDIGCKLNILTTYNGIFHAKVLYLKGNQLYYMWTGSNNLTRDGLFNNVEFGVLTETSKPLHELDDMIEFFFDSSLLATHKIIEEYENERRQYNKEQIDKKSFKWKYRKNIIMKPKSDTEYLNSGDISLSYGDLVMEIMPRETGPDGNQIQFPKIVATSYFGLRKENERKVIKVSNKLSTYVRELTMMWYSNVTFRLSISDLDMNDRPCFILFHRYSSDAYQYNIIPRALFPTLYDKLSKICLTQTSPTSRKWTIISKK